MARLLKSSLVAVALAAAVPAVAQYWPPPDPYGYPPPVPEPFPGSPPYPVPAPGQLPPPAPWATAERPIEPVDLPSSIEQGVDMIYVDPELKASTPARWNGDFADLGSGDEWLGGPAGIFEPVHPIYTELRRGLVRHRMRWGGLPELPIPAGEPLKPGSAGERVSMLRERLGLFPLGSYDSELAARVRAYQLDHALPADGVAGGSTIDSLNRGFGYYERLLLINLERARRLPPASRQGRYVLVDAGAAMLWMYENGRVVDSMKVIVGEQKTATPMMAAMLRYVSLNPYWNVPPEFARDVIAARVVEQGVKYLAEREYEVFSSWEDDAKLVDPNSVDWRAVAAGKAEVKLRRKPSPANSMGAIKFQLPNDYGIYLHDTPDKSLFARDDRWVSNGCIRLEDWKRLAAFLFDGSIPQRRTGAPEERVDLPRPVPIYITYMTAGPGPDGVVFRRDPYKRDEAVLARYFGPGADVAANLRR